MAPLTPLSSTQAAQNNPQFIVIAGSDFSDHLAHFWQTMYVSLLVQHFAVMQMFTPTSEFGDPGFFTYPDEAEKNDKMDATHSDGKTIVSLAAALAVEPQTTSESEAGNFSVSDLPSQAQDEDSVYEADWKNIRCEELTDWSGKEASIVDLTLGVLWMPCSVLIQVFEFLCEGFAQIINGVKWALRCVRVFCQQVWAWSMLTGTGTLDYVIAVKHLLTTVLHSRVMPWIWPVLLSNRIARFGDSLLEQLYTFYEYISLVLAGSIVLLRVLPGVALALISHKLIGWSMTTLPCFMLANVILTDSDIVCMMLSFADSALLPSCRQVLKIGGLAIAVFLAIESLAHHAKHEQERCKAGDQSACDFSGVHTIFVAIAPTVSNLKTLTSWSVFILSVHVYGIYKMYRRMSTYTYNAASANKKKKRRS